MNKKLVLYILLFPLCGFTQIKADWKLPVVPEPTFKKDTFNIINYGAVADGLTLNTKSINDAINACSLKGGGVVLIPGGQWLSGPIELKSNVNLHLHENALLLFTKDKSQYQLVATNWEGVPAVRNQSPLSGTNLQNIAITGKGIINGNGDAWRAVKKDKLTETQWQKLVASGGVVSDNDKQWYPSEQFFQGSKIQKAGVLTGGKTIDDFKAYKDFFRPNLVVLTSCKNVLLDGLTYENSAAWCLHPIMCDNLTVRNVSVKNPWYAQNGDGIDVESCSNVVIENSVFDVGDDGICIKSGRDEEGRKRAMPTQNLIARNCIVYHAHGGFVIGSEMSGGAKNIYVENCTFIGTDIGLRFKTTRGRGGVVENIFVRNINMKDIVAEAILFDMYYMAKDPVVLAGESRANIKVETFAVTDATPVFRNFVIENVVCDGAEKAIFVRGLPEMNISAIHLENITIQSKKGIEITEGKNISMKNVLVIPTETNPVVKINNSEDILFDKSRFKDNAELLFEISGAKTKNIKVLNSQLAKAKTQTLFLDNVSEKVLEIK